MVITQRACVPGDPARHFLSDLKRLLVASVDEHVQIAGHDFVNGVEGRPDFFAIAEAIEKFNWKCAQVSAVVQTLLAFAEFGDNGVTILFEVFIAGARVHQRGRGQIMSSGVVPAKLAIGSFPPAQRFSRRGQPGIDAKRVQQAVGRQ